MNKKNQQKGKGTGPGLTAKEKTQPVKEIKTTGRLVDVDALGEEHGLKAWELAGLKKARGWASGKKVLPKEFEKAVETFRDRRQGGGRI